MNTGCELRSSTATRRVLERVGAIPTRFAEFNGVSKSDTDTRDHASCASVKTGLQTINLIVLGILRTGICAGQERAAGAANFRITCGTALAIENVERINCRSKRALPHSEILGSDLCYPTGGTTKLAIAIHLTKASCAWRVFSFALDCLLPIRSRYVASFSCPFSRRFLIKSARRSPFV